MLQSIIDLSLDIASGTPSFPGDPLCMIETWGSSQDGGCNILRLSLGTHQGTHLDAPYHFYNEGMTVENVPLSQCVGTAFLIDLSHKKPKEPIEVIDLEPISENITEGSRILCRTDWDRTWPTPAYFSDFPYFTLPCAQWLGERRIALLGVDTPTPNLVDAVCVHQALLSRGAVIVESLCNLSHIHKTRFMFVAAPLRIRGGDGSPVRAFAIETEC